MVFTATADLEQQITSLGIKTVGISAVIMVILILIAVLAKNKYAFLKLPLFIGLSGTLVISTVTLFGSTIYLNTKSESKGPVHWHSDIEFWACGAELELRDPTGALSNKIGTATYHEHNDKRIHLEGVVVKKSEDASLEKFMRVTGGHITDNSIGISLNKDQNQWFATEANDKVDGDKQPQANASDYTKYIENTEKGPVLELKNGQECNGLASELQVFVYTYNKAAKTYSQRKLANPSQYTLRDESVVPPGDCVIVEFDTRRNFTNKLCRQYGVRDKDRCEQFGVKEATSELCNIEQTTGGTQ